MQGIIIKAISGFYYVLCDGRVLECKARGIFRKNNITPLVGDVAIVEDFTVTDILPRKNEFDRPPAANVDVMVLVMTASDPAPSFDILDRLTIAALHKGCSVIICVSKSDEADPAIAGKYKDNYKNVFPLVFCSSETGDGISELKNMLSGKTCALCGPSGVGKSSLTNALLGETASATGELSEHTGRGKNTTRHTELFSGEGFLILDTPGFTSFDVNGIPSSDVAGLFPEFSEYLGHCRFDDCVHLKEPGCAVTDAVRAGRIGRSRYRSYRSIFQSSKESEEYHG